MCVRVYRPCNVYQFGRIWITSECLFKVYFDETRLCSVLRLFGRKEIVYVGAFCARRYFLKSVQSAF